MWKNFHLHVVAYSDLKAFMKESTFPVIEFSFEISVFNLITAFPYISLLTFQLSLKKAQS